MAETDWRLEGDYFETCNCDYLCPCITSFMQAPPTTGECKVAIAFQINKGHYGELSLDGVAFVVAAYTPGPMADGDWTVGLIIDDGASGKQVEAIGAIASGGAGGPMAPLAGLIGTFAGIETRPIKFEQDGMRWSISIPDMLEQSCEGVPGALDPAVPVYIENVAHPANSKLALAKATGSHLHAFGIDWDDDSGNNNGHFAPFSWAA